MMGVFWTQLNCLPLVGFGTCNFFCVVQFILTSPLKPLNHMDIEPSSWDVPKLFPSQKLEESSVAKEPNAPILRQLGHQV